MAEDYYVLAHKMVATLGRHYMTASTVGEILDTTDVIRNLMLADSRFNPDIGKSLQNFRRRVVRWAVANYYAIGQTKKGRFNRSFVSLSGLDCSKLYTKHKSAIDSTKLEKFVAQCPLTERQRTVINGRFFESKTLAALGEELGVTREGCRQLETRALLRLQQHARRTSTTWEDFCSEGNPMTATEDV